MTSDQATVRSRSLKSVVQLLDKDPTVLERGAYVMRQILACASDRSPLVRDSALSLISKCLNLKPALEYEALGTILHRTADLAVGVRKRAMKLLKDIYLRNTTKEVRSAIADSLFQRINDTEDSICDLARQMFEEIWISPFYHSAVQDHGSVSFKISLNDQTSLIVKTAQRGGNVLAVLESLLKNIMSQASKNAAANFEVCQAMVAGMFDSIVDNEDAPEKPKQQHVLQTLTVFAKANPKLFTTTQLELLQPYVENLSKFDDLLIYRSVIIIFRFVFPCLPRLQAGFCKMVQDALMRSVSKLGKPELNEAVPCLWTINGVLGNIDRLIRLTISSLQQVYSARNINLADDSQAKTALRVKRYMMITGMFGKYCDFEHEPRLFKESFPWWKGNSVSGLMVDILSLFTASAHPLEVRKQALDSVCNICQFWPKNFLKEQVNSAFDKVFAEGKQDLEDIVLKGFAGFFALEEKRSEKGLEDSADDINKEEAGRLSGALIANENDGISASIAQRYVKPILRIALATQDDYALTAVEVIASINRQGLVHPKECGPTFVSLETSTNARIADIAVAEHRALHGKHESMLEKEYMKAVYQAFMYQKDVVGDSSGTTHHPFHSKLRSFFEVIKTGNGKLRKKFLSSLCARADFDLAKLDVTDPLPEHLLYVRFVADNLAFFEYGRLDELLHLVSCLENVVAGTGTGVAHAIETEVFSVKLDETAKIEPQEESITLVRTTQTPSADRLRQLATASMILSILWETRTFLRRLYGLSAVQKQRDVKGKAAAKDLTRSPTKAPGIHGDRFIDEMLIIMRGLSSPETMMAQCQKFVELLSVDNDFKLAADGENGVDEAARLETPSEDEDEAASVPPSGGSRGGKRKGSHPVDGMVSKVKKSRPSLGGRMRRSSTDVGDADQNADPNWI
ncbi:MAG: hypothetical protein M1819_001175 [Sarea resinae]|nr:MAG: hypothetical protein M1819_001175 [Sarea resinae]